MPTITITLVRASLLLLAGGFAAQHSRVPLSVETCSVLLLVSLVLIVIARLRFVALLLAGFTLFMVAGMATIEARIDADFAGDSMLATVRVIAFPVHAGNRVTMLIEPVNDARLPPKARVTWLEPLSVPALGDIWQLELRLRRPRGNSIPGVFSVENWMFREQMHASGYVVPGKRNRLIEAGKRSGMAAFRQGFVQTAQTEAGAAAAVLAAIGVGTRHLLTQEHWQRYAITGTSHLMAISGLHIGLAASVAFALISLIAGVLRLGGNHLDYAILGSILLAAAYATVSGFAVPAQRATLMLLLGSLAVFLRRRPESLRVVAMAALSVFLIDPISAMAPGFSLSFAAVLLLLWSSRRYSCPIAGRRVWQLVNLQIVLLIGLMPLTVLIFQRIAFVSPVVNLLAVPLFSFVTVPMTLAAMFLAPLSASASHAVLTVASVSVQLIERVIAFFAALPIADTTIAGVHSADSRIVPIILLPLVWVVLPRGWPGRWIVAIAVVALILHEIDAPPEDCVDVHVLDVGQGLSVLVRSQHHAMLFDTGASYRSGGSAAQQLVLPFLKDQGISRIDWLVVSHADNDHAGGVSTLLENLDIGLILAGETDIPITRPIIECASGDGWQVDGVDFRFFHPVAGIPFEGNDSSCVLAVSAGPHHLLLTGDIENHAEQQLLSQWPLDTVRAVVIPHHGSLTSSSPALVNRLRPELAIASTGYGNRWGFPKDRVTRRWQGAGADVLNTATAGTISFRMCPGDGISRLRKERLVRWRFWYDSE